MIESVHCPECQTRYGLRRERIRYGLRRARCFRCEGIFSIEEEVNHLLASGLPQESSALPFRPATFAFSPMDLDAANAEPPTIESIHLDASEMEAVHRGPQAEASEFFDSSLLIEPVPEVEEPLAQVVEAEVPEIMPDSLTLHDLEGAEEEILDKTLVDYHPPTTPRELPPLMETPPEATTTAGGGYSSARDAIDKLLGGMGSASVAAPHSARATGSMDVEATLSALDDTLGGNKIFPVSAPSPAPPVMDFDLSLMDVPEPLAALNAEAAPATVRLSRAEIMAAMAPPANLSEQTTRMPLQSFPESRPELDATLVMLTPPPPPVPMPPPMPVSVPTPFMPVEDSQDQNLFRVQAGTETLANLTLVQMSELVLQGRLADYHMVARQFSENWIEAGKVPALRPVFERVRRERLAVEPPGPPPTEAEAPKRSLFGGLFGRKDG